MEFTLEGRKSSAGQAPGMKFVKLCISSFRFYEIKGLAVVVHFAMGGMLQKILMLENGF